MTIRISCLLLTLMFALCSCHDQANASLGAVFYDFTGSAGTPPDGAAFNVESGPGWGSQLQHYNPSNVFQDGDGHLVIKAVREGDNSYTSGRINTLGKLEMQYGTLTLRVKFPAGQGLWPALWFYGADQPDVGFPACGEIDLLELVNTGKIWRTSLHGPWAGVKNPDYWSTGITHPIDDVSTDFHNYWINRSPDNIVVGIDDSTIGTLTPQSTPSGAEWVFNKPFYMILNLAVGGEWPGPPDATTQFPATLLVDWVRWDPA